MAEDRMLSDEILLGLINKNSGGGGTTNYNNLENQPQINGTTLTGDKSASDLGLVAAETGKVLSSNDYTNEDKAIVGGVTAALADKADKSAVKNEFIGTLEQWNALTEEQKKAYDTYQITNDYTEGSGGLPDYSTTEQKTGQKWIDGKDIYVKSFSTSNSLTIGGEWTATGLTIDGADLIIDGKFIRYESSGVVPCSFNINNGTVRVSYHSSLACNSGYAVTAYYTKTA